MLLESNGRLLSKEELMCRIWPNSFVEEANLTAEYFGFAEGARRAAGRGDYIETVPKHG